MGAEEEYDPGPPILVTPAYLRHRKKAFLLNNDRVQIVSMYEAFQNAKKSGMDLIMIGQGEHAYVVMDNFEKYFERWRKEKIQMGAKMLEKIEKEKKQKSKFKSKK